MHEHNPAKNLSSNVVWSETYGNSRDVTLATFSLMTNGVIPQKKVIKWLKKELKMRARAEMLFSFL